jgi:bifunctional DNA-binding transcriptional regulator/antitoxin component of YhaV-PrlF toxin-antitoxin module
MLMLRQACLDLAPQFAEVILPRGLRQRRNWPAGTRLMVEETDEGVLLRPASLFTPTRPADVFASLKTDGRLRLLEDMDAAILAEAQWRTAGG